MIHVHTLPGRLVGMPFGRLGLVLKTGREDRRCSVEVMVCLWFLSVM